MFFFFFFHLNLDRPPSPSSETLAIEIKQRVTVQRERGSSRLKPSVKSLPTACRFHRNSKREKGYADHIYWPTRIKKAEIERLERHSGRDEENIFNGEELRSRVTGTDEGTVSHGEYKRITCLECISFAYRPVSCAPCPPSPETLTLGPSLRIPGRRFLGR